MDYSNSPNLKIFSKIVYLKLKKEVVKKTWSDTSQIS